MNLQHLWRETKFIAYCLLAGAVGAAGTYAWVSHSPVITPVAAATTGAAAVGIETSFAPIVDKDLPAIVNISSSKKTRMSNMRMPSEMDPFFRQFFGRDFDFDSRPRNQVEHSLGSGVIVRPDGYLLTNNHVIDGANDITITLNDKRELKAKVIGTDPKTDIAVLKVDATNLPVIAMADSSKAHVGDVVLAMGNPFGLGQTVTMGIVSAQGRTGLGIEDYEDFIQTDAPINPGNSGGALVNTRGELIGINTAILANGGNGGNQGVGFAVPVTMARNVVNQVLEHGKVVRGYLGVVPQNITPAVAQAMHLNQNHGVLIGDVSAGGPAEKAGIQRGDVVLDVNGQNVDDANQLRMKISMTPPNTTVQMHVLHNNAEKTVAVKLGELPANAGRSEEGNATGEGQSSALDGVSVDNARGRNGVIVTDVADGSPAAAAGLHQGDIIQEVNRKPVSTVNDFEQAVRNASGGSTLLLVNRNGYTMYMAIQAK